MNRLIANGAIIMLCMAIGISVAHARTEDNSKVRKTVSVTDFDKIDLSGYANVKYTQGAPCAAVITGTENEVKNVLVSVEDGKLKISTKKVSNKVDGVNYDYTPKGRDVWVEVASPSLRAVKSSGTGDFHAQNDIKGDSLNILETGTGAVRFVRADMRYMKLVQNGTGDITFKTVDTEMLRAEQIGTGDIKIDSVESKCQLAKLLQDGTGDISIDVLEASGVDATQAGTGGIIVKDLTHECDYAKLQLSGTGNIQFKFDRINEANCDLSGTGKMKLTGETANLTLNITGPGSADTKQLKVTGGKKISNLFPKRKTESTDGIDPRP